MSNKKEDMEKVTDTAETSKKPASGFGKKLKYGSMSAVVMVFVIAIVIVVNLICGVLNKRYPIKVDLTPDKRYDLTDESINALKNMDKDVEITVTTPRNSFASMSAQYKQMFYQYYGQNVDMPYEIIPEILDKYSVYAEAGKGSISVKYADINKDPDVIARYKTNYNGEIGENNIIFSCGDRVKVIDQDSVVGMISPSQASSQNKIDMVFNGESLITANIMSVTDSNPKKVAITASMNGNSLWDQTHGSLISSFEEFLGKNGYDCTEIDVASDDLSSEKYDMVVVAAPAFDFSEDIISKLSDFLYNGGNYEKNMIYIQNFYATDLPNIAEFLADWKIQIGTDVILDDDMTQVRISALGSVDYAPMLSVSDTEAVGTLPNDTLPIVAPGTRVINVVSKNNESVINEVIKSKSTSYTASLVDQSADKGPNGEYNAIVKSRKESASGISVHGSNLLVIGSPFMLDSAMLSNSNTYNNAAVIINTVNNMTGKDSGVIIPEKAIQQNNISLTTGKAKVIEIIVILVIPIAIAVAGAVVLLRRKNR